MYLSMILTNVIRNSNIGRLAKLVLNLTVVAKKVV